VIFAQFGDIYEYSSYLMMLFHCCFTPPLKAEAATDNRF